MNLSWAVVASHVAASAPVSLLTRSSQSLPGWRNVEWKRVLPFPPRREQQQEVKHPLSQSDLSLPVVKAPERGCNKTPNKSNKPPKNVSSSTQNVRTDVTQTLVKRQRNSMSCLNMPTKWIKAHNSGTRCLVQLLWLCLHWCRTYSIITHPIQDFNLLPLCTMTPPAAHCYYPEIPSVICHFHISHVTPQRPPWKSNMLYDNDRVK